jgi:DNA-binding NtrC family response regulator
LDLARQAHGIIGSAPAFLNALDELARFAAVDVPVFLGGETGTGKELAARAVHYLSRRAGGPFVALNCGALPDRLIENEMFGHGRGAYTDARERQVGVIAQAEGGTLLLDEVDCLDHHSQAALLRFLQDSSYRPLGSGRDIKADVRVIASSNAMTEKKVSQGHFRGDLLFRLNVARVELPPLRARRTDILPLARHLLGKAAIRHRLPVPSIGARAESHLLAHDWPGNVRELDNVMQRALVLSDGNGILPEMLRLDSSGDAESGGGSVLFLGGTLKAERERRNRAFEREYLTWLLDRSAGNITAASVEAGTERRHLGRLIQRHGINANEFRRTDPR